jgi:hypothetical protein
MIQDLLQFWSDLFWWQRALLGAGLFVATFAISLLVVGYILVKMPSTYFLDSHRRDAWSHWPSLPRWLAVSLRLLVFCVKNLLGLALVVFGAIQLFTPGQGLLTILIGIVLIDFPGKRQLERKIISRPKVLSAINRLRARYGRSPLQLDEGPPPRDAAHSAEPSSGEITR